MRKGVKEMKTECVSLSREEGPLKKRKRKQNTSLCMAFEEQCRDLLDREFLQGQNLFRIEQLNTYQPSKTRIGLRRRAPGLSLESTGYHILSILHSCFPSVFALSIFRMLL